MSEVFARPGTPKRPARPSLRRPPAPQRWGFLHLIFNPRGAFVRSAVPALTGLIIVLWSAFAVTGWLVAPTIGFGWTLFTLALIDARHFLLPDRFTLPLLAAGLAVTAAIDPALLPQHLIGAAAGFAVFVLFNEAYRRLRGRDGLGHGDAKLMAALGAWLSWEGLPSVVLIAALAALLVVGLQRLAGREIRADRRLPFGLYLAVGAWLVWLYGPLVFAGQG